MHFFFMTIINEKKLQCKDCVFCTEQDLEHHEGLCTEKHSPKNALGKPMKCVPLWAYACRYGRTCLESDNTFEEEKTQMSEILYAMGGRRSKDIVHLYLSKEDYEKGYCLCGRTIMPRLPFPDWDVGDEEMKSHTCPNCLERLNSLKSMWKKQS